MKSERKMSDFKASRDCKLTVTDDNKPKCKDHYIEKLNRSEAITYPEFKRLVEFGGKDGWHTDLKAKGHQKLADSLFKQNRDDFMAALSVANEYKVGIQEIVKKLMKEEETIKAWNEFQGSLILNRMTGKEKGAHVLFNESTVLPNSRTIYWTENNNKLVFEWYFAGRFENPDGYTLQNDPSEAPRNRGEFTASILGLIAIMDARVKAFAEHTGVENVDSLDDLTGLSGDEFDTIAMPIVAGKDPDDIKVKGDTLKNFLQCYLITEFLGDGSFRDKAITTFSRPVSGPDGAGIRAYYDGRVIPVKMKEPKKFMNYCTFDPDFKDYFESNSGDNLNVSLDYSLYFVKTTNSGKTLELPINLSDSSENSLTGKPISWTDDEEQILNALNSMESPNKADLEVKAMLEEKKAKAYGTGGDALTKSVPTQNKKINFEVTFDGTNPSTARKDVKASIALQLTSFSNLSSQISSYEEGGKILPVLLYELITVPYGIAPGGGNVPGSTTRNQYSPDYNRLRVKIKCKRNTSTRSDLIIDLAVVDHTVSRKENGQTELKINYRGYFESLLSMPFADALADDATIDKRLERDRKLKEAVKAGCSEDLLQEIIRLNRASDGFRARTSASNSLIQRLFSNNRLVEYSVSSSKFSLFTAAGFVRKKTGISFYTKVTNDYKTRYNHAIAGGFKDEIIGDIQDLLATSEEIKDKTLSDAKKSIGKDDFESYFFLLGDLFDIGLDCIFKPGKWSSRKHMGQARLKFLAAPVTVKNPDNPREEISFNPMALPIDLFFFERWVSDNIVDKGVSYYPAMTMIRELIERLVNNLMYEACFANALQDERPPMIRSTFISSTNKNLYNYWRGNNTYRKTNTDPVVDLDAFMGKYPDQKIFEQDSDKRIVHNWCIIYMQSFNDVLPYNERSYRRSPYVPTLKFGINTTDSFVNKIEFSKTNSPGLKEARYFNERGDLSILSNVYDLKITLKAAGATTSIYPGHILNVILTDFPVGERDPHESNTLANNLGFGGYYIVKKVSYNLPTQSSNYTVTYDTKWVGTDASIKFRKDKVTDILIDKKVCIDFYDEVAARVRDINWGDGELDALNILTSRTSEDIAAEAAAAVVAAEEAEAEREAAREAADAAAGVDSSALLEETEAEAERRSELAEADGVKVHDGDLIIDDMDAMWYYARKQDYGDLSTTYQKLQGISNLFKEWLIDTFPSWAPGVSIFDGYKEFVLDHAMLGEWHITARTSLISPTDPDKVGVYMIWMKDKSSGFSSPNDINAYIQEYSFSANAFLHTPEPK